MKRQTMDDFIEQLETPQGRYDVAAIIRNMDIFRDVFGQRHDSVDRAVSHLRHADPKFGKPAKPDGAPREYKSTDLFAGPLNHYINAIRPDFDVELHELRNDWEPNVERDWLHWLAWVRGEAAIRLAQLDKLQSTGDKAKAIKERIYLELTRDAIVDEATAPPAKVGDAVADPMADLFL